MSTNQSVQGARFQASSSSLPSTRMGAGAWWQSYNFGLSAARKSRSSGIIRCLIDGMRFPVAMLIVGSAMAQDARDWLNRGVTAFKNAQYAEATADFQKAADLTPGDAT